MIDRRYALLLTVLGALLLVSCVVSLGAGPARVPVDGGVANIAAQVFLVSVFRTGRPGRNTSSG